MSDNSLAQGYILHEDAQRVVIANGFIRPSENIKTGPMIQVWILARGQKPTEAKKSGLDWVVCGDCALRNACYVNLGQGPNATYDAYLRGNYPALTDYSVFAGRQVRFGAYGDPTHIPLRIIRKIARQAAGWTGYTHQWKNTRKSAYSAFLMASVESVAGMQAAQAAGWRTFRVTPVGQLSAIPGEVVCVNTTTGKTCAECGLCNGTTTRAKSIVIEAHGAMKGNLVA